MKTIYAVSSGEYSDYTVHLVCESKELAETVAKKIRANDRMRVDARVQEMPWVESEEDIFRETIYNVEVGLSDGRETRRWTYSTWSWSLGDWMNPTQEIDAAHHYPKVNPVTAWGRSTRGYDQALKAARDHRTKIQAERTGVA